MHCSKYPSILSTMIFGWSSRGSPRAIGPMTVGWVRRNIELAGPRQQTIITATSEISEPDLVSCAAAPFASALPAFPGRHLLPEVHRRAGRRVGRITRRRADAGF